MKCVQTALILPLILMSCGSVDFLSSTKRSAPETEIKLSGAEQTVVNSQFVEVLLADPEVRQLRLAIVSADLQKDLLDAQQEFQVSASTQLGGLQADGTVDVAAGVELGLTKDADLNGIYSARLRISEHEKNIAKNAIFKKVNDRLFAILSAQLTKRVMDRKIAIIDEGLTEYEGVRSILDTSRRIGMISKGKFLEIQNQVAEVKLQKSQFELKRNTAQETLKIELGTANPEILRKLSGKSSQLGNFEISNAIDPYVEKTNAESVAILNENLEIEKKSSQWNGAYAANLASSHGNSLSGFVGIRLTKPVYDAGQSAIRSSLIQNQIDQTELELSGLKKAVEVAYESLGVAKATLDEQLQLNSDTLNNLLENKRELEIRKDAGKAQLEELAQSLIDISNAKIKLIDLNYLFDKSKLDYLLLNQSIYSSVLDDREMIQLLN